MNSDATEPAADVLPEMNDFSNKAKVFLAMVFLVALAATLVFYNQARTIEQNPGKVNQEKINFLVGQASKIILLPQGETPTVATIANMAPLANNPFFAKAKVGDQVLFYPFARRAFIYRPGSNIIVEVASLNIGR